MILRSSFLLSFLFAGFSSIAQITYSYTAETGSQTVIYSYIDDNEKIQFELRNDSIIIYDENLQNVIASDRLVGAPIPARTHVSINHISRRTIDCDSSNIEYVALYSHGPPPNLSVKVGRIGGGSIFSRDSSKLADSPGVLPFTSRGAVISVNGTTYLQV